MTDILSELGLARKPKKASAAEWFCTIPMSLLGFIVAGHAVSTMWRWFVAPVGVNAIGFWQAQGILVLLGLARFRHPSDEESKKFSAEPFVRSLAYVFVVLVFWGLGWLYLQAS